MDSFTIALKSIATDETSVDELARGTGWEDEAAYLKLAEAARDRIDDYIAALKKEVKP